jgi:hypothetical protein
MKDQPGEQKGTLSLHLLTPFLPDQNQDSHILFFKAMLRSLTHPDRQNTGIDKLRRRDTKTPWTCRLGPNCARRSTHAMNLDIGTDYLDSH